MNCQLYFQYAASTDVGKFCSTALNAGRNAKAKLMLV